MTVTTEITLRSSSLPLVSIPEALAPTEIECVHGLCLQRDVRVFVVQIDSTDEVSADELLALEEVLEVTPLGRTSDTVVYQLTAELADPITRVFDPDRFEGAKLERTIITPEGWYEKKLFKDYETLNAFRTCCQNHGISFDLVSITSDPAPSENSSPHGLTERQYEALNLALSRGYYESPRRTSTEELADEMGISQPSMSSLLRRAERQLLSSALDSQERSMAVTS